jgi:1-acyl-sn-glycerol-3-phosphate acyltransferase
MRGFCYWLTRTALRCLFGTIAKTRVYQAGEARPEPPFLLAANHISHFDPPVLTAALPFPIDWMADAEIYHSHPLATLYFRAVRTFSTDRGRIDRASIRLALRRLEKGATVGLFPDGGIRHGERSILEGAPSKQGAAMLAQMAGVPILPCVVLGSDRLYCKNNWFRLRGTPLWVGTGRMIHPPSNKTGNDARRDLDEQLRRAIIALYADMKARFDLRENDLPLSPRERMRSR